MKAMVFAAGLGTRLRPYTEKLPKVLFPVLGVPVIEWVIRALRIADVNRIVVNLHYHPAKIANFLGDGSRLGVEIHYSDEPIILGTGGGLWAVRNVFQGEEAFFVHNGDVWHTFVLADILKVHRISGANATLALVDDPSQPEARVVTVSNGRVVAIRGMPEKKGGETFVFSGVSVQGPDILEYLPKGAISCLVRHGLVPMIQDGKDIAAARMEGLFCDIGSVDRYLNLNFDLLSKGPVIFFEKLGMEGPREVEKGVFFLGKPTVGKNVNFVPPVLLCDRACVETGATVGPRVIACEEAFIETKSVVENAVVFSGVRVCGKFSGVAV